MFTSSLIMSLYSFALMAVIALVCAGVIKLIVSVLARSVRSVPAAASPKPAAAPRPAAAAMPADVSDELAVIIAAACHAAIGAHRIVYLAETTRAANWTSEIRSRHHLSHVPHR